MNIDLIKKFSENYGSQAIILRLNVIKSEKKYLIFDHQTSKIIEKKLDVFLEELNNIQASELSITLTNLDGAF